MALPNEAEMEEVFKLFDQEGTGIKVKEIGTVMRSLGIAASETQLQDFIKEAAASNTTHVTFQEFVAYCQKCQASEAGKSVNVSEEMQGMKLGIMRFFDKLSPKQIRESPPEDVKIADLKHLLSACGEKMSEEELEEMAKNIRNNCRTTDGRVNFEDFVKLLQV
eukprot:CAMPEP_0194761822 /NCGR_PEP_ID=MMETSP0323_2-20130528/14457_1 /TAXON_ID=2866 ORGANISM="Crypthecodinium cohnii, Strain Seligo" /NCGR_SAMPLE_ID=MMETSP0323_2 /ASSEMBLY_ACC=CAM_ASM_000346 /LENGTH=163 /DNA_ID=CAMNT_0039683729 /DNA_START=86 /DNA_END=577 /DNA_ORIENTATION=+